MTQTSSAVRSGLVGVTEARQLAKLLIVVALSAAALRANVLRPGPAALLFVGALGLALVNVVPNSTLLPAVPFSAAWVWVGQNVWARSG